MPFAIVSDRFWQSGRGPTLERIHWTSDGTGILAIDYVDPEDEGLFHLRFLGLQVVSIVPEEVFDTSVLGTMTRVRSGDGGAAAFDLGASAWLRSFRQQHLGGHRHIVLMFYDQYVQAICRDVVFHDGAFKNGGGDAACADLHESVRLEHEVRWAEFAPRLIKEGATEPSGVLRMRCRDCGQLWRVDPPTALRVSLAIKVTPDQAASWTDAADRAARVRYLERTWGEESAEECVWLGCTRHALQGIAYCVEHLYDQGVRDRA